MTFEKKTTLNVVSFDTIEDGGEGERPEERPGAVGRCWDGTNCLRLWHVPFLSGCAEARCGVGDSLSLFA